MIDAVEALWITLGIVFVAELGDKTQLVTLGLGARHRIGLVLLGVFLAESVAMGLAVLLGGALGAAFPDRAVGVAAALAFFGFALWTLKGDRDDSQAGRPEPSQRRIVLTAAIAVFIAELGDKSMLATATLATRQALFWTWLGAVAGIVAASAVAITVGNVLGARLPDRVVRLGAATLFVLFGALLLVDALVG
jgi:Ca2+/H+ antiporter, TMEM165/GDT1 family